MIPHKTKPFPYNHRNVSKLRFSNITFKLHNNEVNVKRKAQEETGVYREILSRTIRTIAYIHSATRRYTNCKRLCKQTKLRGWVCADEIYRLPKYDLPGYLQNPGASSLRLKCTKSFEEKLGFFFFYCFINTLRKLDKITTLNTISKTIKDITCRGHTFDSPFKFSCKYFTFQWGK